MMPSLTSHGIACPIRNLLFFLISVIATYARSIPMIIDAIESRVESFVKYEIVNHMLATTIPITAMMS